SALASSDRETILRNSVRPLLQPVRLASRGGRTDYGVRGRCNRMAEFLLDHSGDRGSGTGDAQSLRAVWRPRHAIRTRGGTGSVHDDVGASLAGNSAGPR